MTLTMRRYRDDEDFWRIRAFLRQVFLASEWREWSWQAYRFEYWRWHGVENLGHGRLEEDVFLWETAEGEIGAVLNREGPGEVYLQVDPGRRTRAMEEEMMAVAEAHLAVPVEGGGQRLRIWAHEDDPLRQEILRGRGYAKSTWPECQRRRPMSLPIPEVRVAEGYRVRALQGAEELPARSWASWRAFHPNEPDEAYEGWTWYQNVQRAPLYRRDLDMVAVADDGTIASFCTVWFDDVTRSGAFEPVGTAPEHQRKGLGKAVMCEGLRRLERRGALMAHVASYTPPAHALYESVGFVDFSRAGAWAKEV